MDLNSDAEKFFRDADRASTRGFGYSQKGDADKAAKSYREAVELFTKAIELEPDYARAYDGRGDAHEELGNSSAAEKDFRKAVELYTQLIDAGANDDEPYANRANVYLRLKNFFATPLTIAPRP